MTVGGSAAGRTAAGETTVGGAAAGGTTVGGEATGRAAAGRTTVGGTATGRAATGRTSAGRASAGRASAGRASAGRASAGRTTARTVAALAVGLVLAACTTQVPGTARPAAEEPPVPAADLGTVDLCSLLPADRLTELGLAPGGGRPADMSSLRTCTFAPDPAAGPIAAPVVLTALPGSDLDRLLAAAGSDTGPAAGLVRRTEVLGRPAAELGGGPVCTVFVEVEGGVLSLLGGTDCAATQRLAEAAVAGLGG